MEAMVCRRVLTGHHDDILHISGMRLMGPTLEPEVGDRDPSPQPDRCLGALIATARSAFSLLHTANVWLHAPCNVFIKCRQASVYIKRECMKHL
jgi:hypothetical protein